MPRRVSTFLVFLFLTALCAMPALAQFGAIEGDVKDADGKPLVGYAISIDRLDMKGHYETKVKDKKGHYYYGGLPLGRYKVTLQVDGKDVDNVSAVQVRLGDPQKVDFDMKQVVMRKQAAQAGIALPPS